MTIFFIFFYIFTKIIIMRLLKLLFVLFPFLCFSQEHLLVGDSQAFYLANQTDEIKLAKRLAQPGIGVEELTQKIDNYPISENIKSVSVSIGVNDGYEDKGVNELLELLNKKFPNAKILIIKGSYGWGNVKNIKKETISNYYHNYEGCIVVTNDIGPGDPHSNKKIYKIIINEILNIIN